MTGSCLIEKCLIEHCAPTLASLKAASLFNACCKEGDNIDLSLEQWNKTMNAKGIRLLVLRKWENHALVYVYREKILEEKLKRPETAAFLRQYGYESSQPEACLPHLQERFAKADGFPHEIGIFLDYPLGDVIGFIKNGGQNYKCAGCWKVYCNECETMKLFQKYRKCKNVYRTLWEKGRSVLQLTVAA